MFAPGVSLTGMSKKAEDWHVQDAQNILSVHICSVCCDWTSDHTAIRGAALETRAPWLEVLTMWNPKVKRPKRASLRYHENMEGSSLSVKVMGLNGVWNFRKKMRVIFLALIFHVFFQLSHHTLTLDLDLLLLTLCAPSFGGGEAGRGRGEIWAEKSWERRGARLRALHQHWHERILSLTPGF